MWDLVERLAATLWMLRAPIAICGLIFCGMAAIAEIDGWHGRTATAAHKACAEESGKAPAC